MELTKSYECSGVAFFGSCVCMHTACPVSSLPFTNSNASHLGHEAAPLLLQLLLLLEDEPAQELVLKAALRHRAVHDRKLGRQLRGQLWVGQAAADVELEPWLQLQVGVAQRDKGLGPCKWAGKRPGGTCTDRSRLH